MSELTSFRIVKDSRRNDGWVRFDFAVDGAEYAGEAKVYNQGDGAEDPNDYNGYGVQIGSRVSKLRIIKWLPNARSAEVYCWDRGLDFCHIPDWIVEAVDEELNELPLVN